MGCASVTPQSAPLGYSDEVYNASSRAVVLQSIVARDPQPVADLFIVWLTYDIKVLASRLKGDPFSPLTSSQRESALRTLVTLAVLHERNPVPAWQSDPEVAQALAWALGQDDAVTARIRARNWSKSFYGTQ
jgi:hypothetical protein